MVPRVASQGGHSVLQYNREYRRKFHNISLLLSGPHYFRHGGGGYKARPSLPSPREIARSRSKTARGFNPPLFLLARSNFFAAARAIFSFSSSVNCADVKRGAQESHPSARDAINITTIDGNSMSSRSINTDTNINSSS